MNNKCLPAIFAALCVAFVSQSTYAAKGFKYSYGEFGYQRIDADSIESNGFLLGFSFGATDLIHIDGEYGRHYVDDFEGIGAVNLDVNTFKIGGGAHFTVMDNVDLLGTVRWIDAELSGTAGTPEVNFNEDVEGFEYELGARIKASKALEITSRVLFQDTDVDEDTGVGVGLVYKLDKNFSLRLKGDYFEDDDEIDLFAGVRLILK